MSSRTQYDSRESRPSSRDRSPGRYNDSRDSDQYRGGTGRATERRRSIPDSRASSSAFPSNRDSYSRESPRDFPPREPPRGPKALIDAPSGPRASTYGGDFRGDFGHRSDFRGRGGRGRGRGGWRDDSRDRGREAEREREFVRDRRDDRGPPPPFRDDRNRDRDWGRERDFKSRRASSPPPRARSPPTYGARDSRDVRDVPLNVEIDRTRRDSRDGPSLAPSSSLESPYARGFSGYGRARGSGRGRGRGSFYEDPRQQQGRSRSPDPQWARRPQPSATPPPQVPAFGSTSTSIPTGNLTPTPATNPGPVPGIAVPTAPRSHAPASRNSFGRVPGDVNSVKWINPDFSTPKQTKAASDTSKFTGGPSEPGFSPPRGPAQNPDPQINRGPHPSPGVMEKIEGIPGTTKIIPESIPQGPRSLTVPTQPAGTPTMQDRDRRILSPNLGVESSRQLPANSLTSPDPQEPRFSAPTLTQVNVPASQEFSQTRRPVLSKRRPQVRKPNSSRLGDKLSEDNSSDDGFDSDSGVNDKYFEEEITKITEQIAKSSEQNDLLPIAFPSPIPLKFPPAPPIIEELVAKDVRAILNAEKDRKEAVVLKQEPSTVASIKSPEIEVSNKDRSTVAPRPSYSSGIAQKGDEMEISPADEGRDPRSIIEADQTNSKELTSPIVNSIASASRPIVNDSSNENGHEGATGRPVDVETVQDMKRSVSVEPAALVSPIPTSNGGHVPMLIDHENKEAGIHDQAGSAEEIAAAGGTIDDRLAKPAPLDSVHDFEDRERTPLVNGHGNADEREAKNISELEAVRRKMNTPPLSSLKNLPFLGIKKWNQDEEFLKTLNPKPAVEASLKKARIEILARRNREQEVARQEWKQRYLNYRKWTDLSDDPVAVKHRKRFQAAQLEEAKAAQSAPVAEARQEPRNNRKFASQADIDRVLAESAREALEQEMQLDARAKTANEKEAIIPDMYWDEEERQERMFIDRTHLVPFERSFSLLEFGEPVDNFTEEESLIFEKTYLEFPKQWGKIAEALEKRDFKACIQHYYLVKHDTNLKGKVKALKPKRGRNKGRGGAAGAKPKSNALMADLVAPDNDGEDKPENENGGERRRPRRAAAASQYNTAAAEAAPSESENATPVPTPGRKSAATPKDERVSGAPAKRKAKGTPREKASKQSKNSQLLAAAPPTNSPRPGESSTAPEWKADNRRSAEPNRFAPQYDGPPKIQAQQPTFSPYVPMDTSGTPMSTNFESRPTPTPERIGSAPPSNFDAQQDRRSIQQTSSYWSVPEQTDFPALLRHFGTDWHGIAKWMTSKTHIMVYTTVFQQWLAVPSDSNKSRRVANIQTQVKNYYQRQVDSGKMSEWEEIARDADEKRERGESTGPLPTPSILPKRRYDGPQGAFERPDSAMNGMDDVTSGSQTMVMPKTSPPQPNLSTRFPALAQAGPVPQTIIQPATSGPTSNSHYQQPIQHMPQQIQQMPQQIPPQPRPSRGPTLGYFNTDRDRSVPSAANPQQARPSPHTHTSDSSISQRSLMAAQEAQLERQQALKIEQQQQQQAMEREQREQREQRDRELRDRELRDRELRDREMREQRDRDREQREREQREREQREHRERMMKQENEMHNNMHQYEPYSAQMLQSNVMAHSRVEAPPPLVAADVRRTAPPQQYQHRNPQVRSILGDSIGAQQMPSSSPSPAIPRAPMSAPPTSQEQYSVPPPPPPQAAPAPARQQETVRKTSSIMSLLNDEPSEPRPQPQPQPPKRVSDFAANTIQASQTPPPREQMYSQPSRPAVNPQPPHIRRESSLGDLHGAGGGYGRTSGASQSSMRLKESPYSATTPVQPAQAPRQQIASPLDLAPPSEREYYQRQQPPYLLQQQQNTVSSPQLGPSYHAQSQQQPSHRQLAFGQAQSHAASPPPVQYTGQHSIHRSRQNSLDSRYATPVNASATPAPPQQGYSHAPPQQHGTPLSMQYQPQHALQPSRYAAPAPQSTPIPPQQLSQQLAPQQQSSQPQHPYAQSASHPMHHHSSSIGQPRSFTPTNYESRGYGPPPPSQQAPLSQERMVQEQEAMMRREMIHQQRPIQDPYDGHYERRRMEDEEYQRRYMDSQRRR